MRLPTPVVRTAVASVASVYRPPFPPRLQRALVDPLAAVLQRPARGVPVADVTLGGVPARRYGAPNAASVLWVHGGAFITGSYRTHGSFASHLARESGLAVHLLDYRLAPEHPHPAAVDDVVTAREALPGRVVMGGDSAGGCLALLALPRMQVEGVALVSPVVDLTLASSGAWTGRDPVVRSAWARQGVGAMFGTDLPDVPDPTVPTVVHVASEERLRAEGEALAQRVGAELLVVDGWHDVHLQCDALPAALSAVRALAASIGSLLATR